MFFLQFTVIVIFKNKIFNSLAYQETGFASACQILWKFIVALWRLGDFSHISSESVKFLVKILSRSEKKFQKTSCDVVFF